MMPPAAARVFDLVTSITFAVTGLSKDKQVYSALGSGFFVAPYTGITAAHVLRGLWDDLEMPWKKGHYPKSTVDPSFYLAAVQQVDRNNAFLAAHWEITGATPLQFTDIAILNLVPKSEVAHNFLWPNPFPPLELLPPRPDSRVWAFGYPGLKYVHTPSEEVVDISAEPTLIEGAVTQVFAEGRATWSFPQFEVTCPFEPGMSGGPVLHQNRICGVVSYGPELENNARGPSFAAALWPILASEQAACVDPRLAKNAVLDMIKAGGIAAPGWRSIESIITSRRDAEGETVLSLKTPTRPN